MTLSDADIPPDDLYASALVGLGWIGSDFSDRVLLFGVTESSSMNQTSNRPLATCDLQNIKATMLYQGHLILEHMQHRSPHATCLEKTLLTNWNVLH